MSPWLARVQLHHGRLQRTEEERARETQLRNLWEEGRRKTAATKSPRSDKTTQGIPVTQADNGDANQPRGCSQPTNADVPRKGLAKRVVKRPKRASEDPHSGRRERSPRTASRLAEPGEVRPAVEETRMSLLRAAEESFYLDRQLRLCTEATIKGYQRDLGLVISWLERNEVTDPCAVMPDHLRAFLSEQQARDLSPRTLHHYANAARIFFNYLVNEELITRSPMERVPMPRLPKELLPAFTVDETRALVAAAKQSAQPLRDAAMVLGLLDNGCRASEFVALNVGDVDLKTGAVTIRQGKGGKDRVTFLGAKARKALLRYQVERRMPDGREPLWQSQSGERLTQSGMSLMLRRLARRAKVQDVHPHKFRRTFALWSLRAGMNIYSLQMMMGHSDLQTLRRYLALVEADLEQQHREHGAVDSML